MKQITNKLKEQGVEKKSQFISFMLLTFLMVTFQVNAQTTETFTTTGTFTVPAGVATVQVEAWAGGGSGGGATGNPSGGGGGAGGNYVKSTSVSVPLSSYTVSVGLGATGTTGAGTTGNSSWFGTTGTILATGGIGGSFSSTSSSSAAGATATTTGCVGTTINKGGNGGTGATGATGGGGGSSASTISALANNGGVTTAGAAPTGGAAGGNAGLTTGNGGAGNPGSFPGGGGGGGRSGNNSDRSGADGGDGQVKVTYTCPTYALTAATTSSGPFCGVATSVLTLKSSSMGSGTYTVTYNLTGSTTATASTATMTFTAGSPGTGTFTTSSISIGTTTVTITKLTSAGCNNTISSNNTASIVVNTTATAVSGTAITTCSTTGAVNITTGSSATNTAGVLWSSNGTGTFTNPTSLTTCTYTPSAGDIVLGSVSITLTATGNSPCVNATSSKLLSISTPPLTETTTICQGGSGNLTSSTNCGTASPVNVGPKNAGTGANNNTIGTVAWTSSGNITTVGSPYASVATVNTSAITNYIQGTNYGFAIPTNAVINGITVVINRQSTGTTSPFLQDNRVSLVKGGTVQTTNRAVTGVNWPNNNTVGASLAAATYGSIADLWGTTWTATDINNANFGVVLSAVNASTANSRTATVDYIQIRVNYTDPITMNWYTVSSGGTAIGSGNSFNPVGVAGSGLANTNTAGTTTFYAACSTNTECRTSTDFVINPNITPTFTGVSLICAGGTLLALPVTSNNGITGTWSPALDNMATTIYTFTPTVGLCATTAQLTITVNPNITPTFTAVAPICFGGIVSALPLTSNNGITGTWSPALDNLATTTYTFTPDSGQCATTSTLEIIVNPIVTPTFTGVFPICAGGTLSALPLTSNNGINGTWSPAIDNMATTTYTFTPTLGLCATTAQLTITVNPNVTPTFTAIAPICVGGIVSALPIISNNFITGTWSPALNTIATTTYTFTPDSGQCATTSTLEITVNPIVTPTFTGVLPICTGGILLALPIISNNLITGTWSPALNTMATTTYTFTPDSGQCAITTTLQITVNPIVTPTFTGVFPICAGGTLSALPLTSNNGITGTWSPALDNMATTTYTFTPTVGECATSTTLEIIVNNNVLPLFDAVAPICTGTSLSALPTTSNNGIMGTWSPALNNTATTTYTFTPNPGRCSLTTTLEIVVDTNTTTYYADVDGDGYGDATSTLSVCSGQPTGYVSNNTDCLDTNAQVNPNHVEVLGNGIDDNCSGSADEVGPTAKVIPSQCGMTLVSLWNNIFSITVGLATNYRFEVSNGAFVRTFDTTVNRFNLYNIAGIAYGTTYSIRVSIKRGGFWQAYGTSCNITTPAFPPTTNVIPSQCGMTITNFWSSIFVNQVIEATGYLIELTDAVNGVRTFAIPNGGNRFNLRNFVGGGAANTVYTVRVAIRYNGVYQSYGSPCTITTTAGAVRESEGLNSDVFAVNAFPNPFADNFKLDIETSNENAIDVKVYDMMGRVIEFRRVKTTDLNSLEIGANYSSGVYNIIITQGENVKTLRVIKR